MSASVEDPRQLFRSLFLGPNTHSLFSVAMRGQLPSTGLRGIAWRYFLGSLPAGLPVSGWALYTQQKRQDYAALMEEHCIDPHRASAELDPTICNPLSQHAASPWSSFFETEELRTEILKDLSRLHPNYSREGEDNIFFSSTAILEAMLRVLVVWSQENAQLSYRQGMHELLAALILAVHNDAEQAALWLPAAPTAAEEVTAAGVQGPAAPAAVAPEPSDLSKGLSDESLTPLLRVLLSPEGVEADAYWLFDELMHQIKNWFVPGEMPASPLEKRASVEEQRRARLASEKRSPLLQKCAYIQEALLRRADPQLYAALTEKEVQPQLYLLRWLRLLFGREFHLSDSMLVWDALFAYGQAASCPCHAVLFAHPPRLPACSFRACNSSSTWLWRCCCTCAPRLSRAMTPRRSAAS